MSRFKHSENNKNSKRLNVGLFGPHKVSFLVPPVLTVHFLSFFRSLTRCPRWSLLRICSFRRRRRTSSSRRCHSSSSWRRCLFWITCFPRSRRCFPRWFASFWSRRRRLFVAVLFCQFLFGLHSFHLFHCHSDSRLLPNVTRFVPWRLIPNRSRIRHSSQWRRRPIIPIIPKHRRCRLFLKQIARWIVPEAVPSTQRAIEFQEDDGM